MASEAFDGIQKLDIDLESDNDNYLYFISFLPFEITIQPNSRTYQINFKWYDCKTMKLSAIIWIYVIGYTILEFLYENKDISA